MDFSFQTDFNYTFSSHNISITIYTTCFSRESFVNVCLSGNLVISSKVSNLLVESFFKYNISVAF